MPHFLIFLISAEEGYHADLQTIGPGDLYKRCPIRLLLSTHELTPAVLLSFAALFRLEFIPFPKSSLMFYTLLFA